MVSLAVMGAWAASPQLCYAMVRTARVPYHPRITAVSVIRTASSPPLLQQTTTTTGALLTLTLWLAMASTTLPNTETHCAGSGRATTQHVGSAVVAARRPAPSQWPRRPDQGSCHRAGAPGVTSGLKNSRSYGQASAQI